eukprot:gene14797-16331_t
MTYMPSQEDLLSENEVEMHGIDWDGPLPSERFSGPDYGELGVNVPDIFCPLTDAQFHLLEASIDPLGESISHGIDIYLNAREFVSERIE